MFLFLSGMFLSLSKMFLSLSGMFLYLLLLGASLHRQIQDIEGERLGFRLNSLPE